MKVRAIIYRTILGLMLLTVLGACIDELDIETFGESDAKGLLVVEAVLSDEVITQKVYLSRSDNRLDLETDTVYNPYIPLGSQPYDSVDWEERARVRLLGNNGTEFLFTEGQSGFYFSNEPFALQMGVDYELEITTSGGTDYTSDPIAVQGTSEVTNLYAERAISNSGVEGVAIYVDSQPTKGSSEYLKYTYDETYEIVAPYWSPSEFVLTDYEPCALPFPTYNLEVVAREIENRVCYNTVSSTTIEQLSMAGNPTGQVSKHMVRFIGKDNFIISNRYSILVQQQVQSPEAFSFYEVLKSFSQSNNPFSQVQPGAIYANVHRSDGSDEHVLGFVEAVGVSEQRLFFNYEDFFPGEELPPYPFVCNPQSTPESHTSYCTSDPAGNPCPLSVIESVNNGLISYFSAYDENLVPNASCPGPYVFVPRICGDCTLMGSNVKPDFWEE
ncbi:DUF4249 domain-containing protein [Flagellimonas sediminis]|uniref:DUF4249 family protein n=1 Tax=Flagellimonas sediminis TaxID=2696468 RepID=A0A6I5L179_9FLAO|nr:DUF4249 domain-containing protein [Allomuricauda sediminis]NDV43521.1 DUF4249 family protein [Allomuricauda sediminis]